MSTKQCTRCNKEKTTKAKGLCNACYTAICRENSKKVKLTEISEQEEEFIAKEMMLLVLKQQEENIMLRQKLELLQNSPNSIGKEGTLESTTTLIQTPTSTATLSDSFVQRDANQGF